MKHIKTVNKPTMQKTLKTGGCGECQASCQSACKTSCTVGNQVCESRKQALKKDLFLKDEVFSSRFAIYLEEL